MKMNLNRPIKWTLGLVSITLPALGADGEELRNWIEVGGGGNLISGDKAAFQQRTGQPRDGWGGVTDFHYEADVGKKSLFEVDGRGIFDANNYAISLSLKDPDRGYIKVGFEEFRSYYDGSGGYFAGNGQFFSLYNTDFEVDRRRAFLDAALTLENKPNLRIRYEMDGRDGTKNSTSWGDTSATPIPGTRKIVPSFLRLDEDRHTVALDVSHVIGRTEAGLGGRYQFSTYDNGRYERRNPGVAASDRFLTHREGQDTDLFSAHAFTDTDLTDQIKLTTGYSFTRLDTDISGSRVIGGDYDAIFDPAFARRQVRDHGFLALNGGSMVNQHVGSINLLYRPIENLAIVPSIRVESQAQNGSAAFTDTEVTSAAGFPTVTEDILNLRNREFIDVTESIDVRYSGVTNWVFYARTEWLQGDGTLSERERFIDDLTKVDIVRSSDSGRFTQKYAVGANWYPHKRANAAFQYYHKRRDNNYDHTVANTEGLYPGYLRDQNFTTDDANLRVTLRPWNSITFISRYDFQFSTIDSQMGVPGAGPLPSVESANSTAHIISESVTWSPIARMYLQGSGSYTMDRLHSPANNIIAGRAQVTENNYYTASGTIGYALSEKTDATVSYNFYLADNYEPGNATSSLAFGAGLEEHAFGAGVVHRFSNRMQLTTRYAFMTSHEDTSGGYNDFDAHMISTALRFRF